MHIGVNGTRLFFDVEGAKLVPDGEYFRRPCSFIAEVAPS